MENIGVVIGIAAVLALIGGTVLYVFNGGRVIDLQPSPSPSVTALDGPGPGIIPTMATIAVIAFMVIAVLIAISKTWGG